MHFIATRNWSNNVNQVQRLTLPDGRTYIVMPGYHGFRVVRTNCGTGRGAQRVVPAFTPLWDRLVSMAQAKSAA